VERLIAAGALDGFGVERRQLLWALGGLHYRARELPLGWEIDPAALPVLTAIERQAQEMAVLGLSLGAHVLAGARAELAAQGFTDSVDIRRRGHGERARLAGVLVVHQSPPTAKGFHFLTLEDEFGLVDVIVRPPVYVAHRTLLRSARLLVVTGTIQYENGIANLLALSLVAPDRR